MPLWQAPQLLNNFTATTNPGVGDDSADGYGVGSVWLNTTDGIWWRAANVTVGAAVWIPMGVAEHGGFVVGNYYADAATAATAGNIGAADTLYAHPVVVRERMTIDGLGMRVSTGGSAGNGKFGIMSHDWTTKRPNARIAQSAGVAVGTSAADLAAALSATINPGIYWLVSIFDAVVAAFNIAGTSGGTALLIGGTAVRSPMPVSAGSVAIQRVGGTISYANGIPSTWTALGGTETVVTTAIAPLLVWKKA